MGVRFLQCFSAGIISILSFTSLSYAQQIALPQPLITIPPGVGTKQTHSRVYRLGDVTTPIAPMMLQPSVFPLFIEDNEFSSLITLVNSSRVSSSALLTIRDPQGKAYTPVSIRFTAQAKVQIKVADLLQKIGIHLRTGSILLTQGPELKRPSIIGQLTLSETSATPVALTEEELVMPMFVDSQDLRSVSESATDAQLIAVSSLSSEAQHISAQCYKRTGVTTKTATLAPGGTALLYPCSTDSSQIEGISLLGVSETTESAGIAIHSDGPNGGFAAFGLARHLSPETKSDFLGSLQFIDPTSLQSSALVFTGVSAGYSLTPGPHPYSAAVAVANFSTQQNHITIAFHKTDSNGSVSSTTRDIALAPESSTQISLGQLGLKSGEIGSLIVSSDQSPGDTMAKIVSSSDMAPNQLEQLAKDSLSHRNGGAHPWTLQDNSRSDLVLFNHSSRTEPFNILITTEDGVQWIQHLVLAPFETKNISINDLIRNKTPDIHGRIIPATTWSGTVIWHTDGPGIGSGHVLIRNDNNSTGENFSCDQTFVVCGASVTAYPTTMAVGDTGTAYAIETFCVEYTLPGYCGGGDNSYDDNAYNASWVSADSTVVSVIEDTTTATYQGMASGSTYLTGTIGDSWGCSASATSQDITVTDATPIVTGIDPSDWPSDGVPHQVTFTGQYFGNNQPNLTFSDSTITASLLSYSDTQIIANVTVPSGTPDEDVTVSVTSNGYNGNAFASGGGAVSPTSFQATASVKGANKPTVTIALNVGDQDVSDNSNTKSNGDNINFYQPSVGVDYPCSETLGLKSCTQGWFWNVEGVATVSDDASNWTVTQVVTGKATGYDIENGTATPFTTYKINQPDGPQPTFLQQPSQQKTIYWLDSPGYFNSPFPIYSATVVYNFVTTYCTQVTICTPINWYLKLVIDPGGHLNPNKSRVALGLDTESF